MGGKKLDFFFLSFTIKCKSHSQVRQELVNTIPALAKLQNACVSRHAEFLSKASHLLLWLLHWEFSSKQEKKCKSLLVFLDLTYGVNIIGSMRDASGKTTAY